MKVAQILIQSEENPAKSWSFQAKRNTDPRCLIKGFMAKLLFKDIPTTIQNKSDGTIDI